MNIAKPKETINNEKAPLNSWLIFFSPFWLVAMPSIVLAIIFGHISLITKFGSDLDPVGYTILLKK